MVGRGGRDDNESEADLDSDGGGDVRLRGNGWMDSVEGEFSTSSRGEME